MILRIYRQLVYTFLFSIAIFLTGCVEQETHVIIFHTNDSHAQLDNIPALSYLVNKERETGSHVFLVSAGDIFSGNPVVDNYDPPGFPIIDLMNIVGYDLHTIGNHEFDYGIDILEDRMRQADFPFILANLDTQDSGMAQPEPFHILNAGRYKIAFLGLVQLNSQGIPSTHPDKVKGINFYKPLEAVRKFDFLSGQADVVVGLTHHGFVSDTLMAWQNPWFDVIIGGHSHTLTLEPRTYNDVLVSHAGANLNYAGKITLVFRDGELAERRAEMISMESVNGKDLQIAELIDMYKDNPALNRVIGRLVNPLEDKQALGSFITDAYRAYGELDLAFHNYGGIRVDRMEGEITIKDIFRMDPFGNELVVMSLTYDEIKSLIGNSLSSRKSPSVQISGGFIEVHLTSDDLLEGIKIFNTDNEELTHNRKFLVGMPSYMASAFDFDHEDPGISMGIITAQVLIEHITQLKDIEYKANARSRIVRTKN
jgi:5'-nucleotidase / UDP-sugar diphosphatase